MIVVFDSSPIIFLSRLGIIDKALSLFKTSYIPEKAIEEILFKKDISHEILSELLESNKLLKVKAKSAKLFNALKPKLFIFHNVCVNVFLMVLNVRRHCR